MMREENHIFQGMRRDNHQIKQDAKFLWDARNIRITDREDNTFLSVTNEKGTSESLITFDGCYVGHCILGKYLVVFTSYINGTNNIIYRVEKEGDIYKTIILFQDEADDWEYRWDPEHPIEAIGIYETELIQKIYWVDGKNQPRVINITKPELLITNPDRRRIIIRDGANFSNKLSLLEGLGQGLALWIMDNLPELLYKRESFDFVRTLDLSETIYVTKVYGQGLFSPGTIQYAFSYYDKYGQESNIFYTTPLYYISPKDRGGSPEEKVANSFDIDIFAPDFNFDYVRVYSIHRTSLDAVPTVKVVADIPIKLDDIGEELSLTDTGTIGYTIDPTQLLYIGGVSIIANCITLKDRTLFLGNISINNNDESKLKLITDEAIDNGNLELDELLIRDEIAAPVNGSYYNYNVDRGRYRAGFMANEIYRCGYQVQFDNGKWSNPIFLGDYELNDLKPWESTPYRKSSSIKLLGISKKLRILGAKKIRACVVFPKPSERQVMCLGILCPTVFSVQGRRVNSPYAMSSWFFRPATDLENATTADHLKGSYIQFLHNKALYSGADRGAEILNMLPNIKSLSDITSADLADLYSSSFFVDENIVTFHSPDIEFDSDFSNYLLDGLKLRILGVANLGAISGDIDLQTSTPTASSAASGFTPQRVGFRTGDLQSSNGGLVTTTLYNDCIIKNDFSANPPLNWPIYPWHRSGSINNDSRRESKDSIRTSVLLKKKISNLKFFSNISPTYEFFNYNITTPLLFNSNELSTVKIKLPYLDEEVTYLGNVDTLVTSNNYPLNYVDKLNKFEPIPNGDFINTSSEPVRIKYKSTPHLVFSIGNLASTILLLPRHASLPSNNSSFLIPNWQNTNPAPNTDIGKYDYVLNLYAPDKYLGYAPEALIGQVAIGALLTRNSVYIVASLKGKAKYVILSQGDLVLKVVGGLTSIVGEQLLPGTLKSLYTNTGLYIGPTKYYKVTYINSINIRGLEDITDSITSSINSRGSANTYKIAQDSFGILLKTLPYLLIGELYRDSVVNKFGGNSEEAKRENLWIPASNPVRLEGDDITISFEYGDTWYSRYDCLKTYPFTQEDENQIIEIGSFMCETRVNIDGRYDKNRGQLSNLNMTPQNFNLFNDVYSLKDNFFNYRILDEDYYKQNTFANQVTWSKEKSAGEEIDTWTNITLANTLDMDGEKGNITSLKAWNEYLLCFQDKALSQILFNSRTQIPVTDGVPIEISNGYKVDGSRLFNGTIGCSDKWTIATTILGVYFLDSNTNSIYIFNGQLTNLSEDRGMSWWVKQNYTDKLWNPIHNKGVLNGIRTFYDSKYGDIYFTPGPVNDIDQPDALCYSELLGQFTSLMSYGGTLAMFNFAGGFYSLRGTADLVNLYLNNVGNYNYFYDNYYPFSISFIANGDPIYTKVFDTIELRADSYNDKVLTNNWPFSSIKAENEYQESNTIRFEDEPRSIRKKFRVWRINIPRSSKVANMGTPGVDTLRKKVGRARIRNPWTMITLTNDKKNDKIVLHDLTVKYTI